jgi:hypothetical protein
MMKNLAQINPGLNNMLNPRYAVPPPKPEHHFTHSDFGFSVQSIRNRKKSHESVKKKIMLESVDSENNIREFANLESFKKLDKLNGFESFRQQNKTTIGPATVSTYSTKSKSILPGSLTHRTRNNLLDSYLSPNE